MENEERALSIFWLDGGLHPARAIAQRNNISEEELEYELAIFKSTNIFRQKYEPIIREDITAALTNYPFMGWNKHICMRVLPNQRIECIIAETRYCRKFYHAYIPDREYMNSIFSHSFISWQQDFFHIIGIKGEEQWRTFPFEQQLNLLLDNYESEAFIPYRRLIIEDEEWISSYTNCDVTPYINHSQYNKNLQPSHPRRATFRIATPPSIPFVNEVSPDYKMSMQEMIDKKLAIWKNSSGKIFQKPLSATDLAILKEKSSQKEELRLEYLYTEGLDALTDIEKNVFVYIDVFYNKYNLQEAILSNNELLFHSELDRALKNYSGNTILGNNSPFLDSPEERIAEKERFNQMLQIILNVHSSNIQKDIQLTNIRNLLNEYSEDSNFIQELWQILLAETAQLYQNNSFIDELFYLMQEYGFSRNNTGSTSIANKITATMDNPVDIQDTEVIPWEEEIMLRRTQILNDITKGNQIEDFLIKLQITEDEIICLPQNKRPAGYPERNKTLYQLYWSGQIKTLSEVCSLIINELSTEELATLCNNLSLS